MQKFLFKTLIKSIKINSSQCNTICLFPESGNYIKSSLPSILNKNNNRIKSFKMKNCNNSIIINENEFVLSDRNSLCFVKIKSTNKFKIQEINKAHRAKINSIIKGIYENQIISSDINGNIRFCPKRFQK